MMPSFAISEDGDSNNNHFRSSSDGSSSIESSPPAVGANMDDLAFKISMMGLQAGSSVGINSQFGTVLHKSTAEYLESVGAIGMLPRKTTSSDSGASSGEPIGVSSDGYGDWLGNAGARSASPLEGSTDGLLAFLAAQSATNNVTETVQVPSSEHVAEIVGRQGCKIKALRAKTNTYIKTPVRGDDAVFVVTGRPEDVVEAKREIELAAEHFTQIRASRRHSQGGAPAPGHITAYVRVPLRVVGLVVGPKGATIKRIQQDTHTYIITPSREREPIFEVTGLPQNVEAARREIEMHIYNRTGTLPVTDPSTTGFYQQQVAANAQPQHQTINAAGATTPAQDYQGNQTLLQQQQMRAAAAAAAAYYGTALTALRRASDTNTVGDFRGTDVGLTGSSNISRHQQVFGMKPLSTGGSPTPQLLDGAYQAWSLGGNDAPTKQHFHGANNEYIEALTGHPLTNQLQQQHLLSSASLLQQQQQRYTSLSNGGSSYEDEGYHGACAPISEMPSIISPSVRDAFNNAVGPSSGGANGVGATEMVIPHHLFMSSIWSDLEHPTDKLPVVGHLPPTPIKSSMVVASE